MKAPKRSILRSTAAGASPEGPSVVLLHGMLGDVDNWYATLPVLARSGYRVNAPLLPVYTSPIGDTSVRGLTDYVLGLLAEIGDGPHVLVGNSLGGHVALCAALRRPDLVRALVLSGASGLYEVSLGTSTPRRFDRDFVRDRTAYTFHDPVHATDALVDRMMDLLADRARLARLVMMARSARDTRVGAELTRLCLPTLLVWGRQDRITPPAVARQFEALLPNSTLALVDNCGHAPMIEQPEIFNDLLLAFLRVHAPSRMYAL